jgi:hypothetical protein
MNRAGAVTPGRGIVPSTPMSPHVRSFSDGPVAFVIGQVRNRQRMHAIEMDHLGSPSLIDSRVVERAHYRRKGVWVSIRP